MKDSSLLSPRITDDILTQDITDGSNFVLQLMFNLGGSDLKTPYSTVYDSDRCIFLHPWSDFFFFFLNVLMQLPPLLMALVTPLLLIPLIDGREFTIRPPAQIVLRISNFMKWVNVIWRHLSWIQVTACLLRCCLWSLQQTSKKSDESYNIVAKRSEKSFTFLCDDQDQIQYKTGSEIAEWFYPAIRDK